MGQQNERQFTAYRERWALLLDIAGPAEIPSFVSWVHLLPAALEIVLWLDEKSDSEESEYLIASQARELMNRRPRDLETADVDLPRRRSTHGTGIPAGFEGASNAPPRPRSRSIGKPVFDRDDGVFSAVY